MNLRFGMMTPTVLDMAALFGLSPLGVEVNAALVAPEAEGSFKAAWPMVAKLAGSKAKNMLNYSSFYGNFGMEDNADDDSIAPLGEANEVTLEFAHLADCLAQGGRLALGPFLLGHIYRTLHDLVTDGMKPKHGGPLWAFQFWLQAYFPELRGAGDLGFLPGRTRPPLRPVQGWGRGLLAALHGTVVRPDPDGAAATAATALHVDEDGRLWYEECTSARFIRPVEEAVRVALKNADWDPLPPKVSKGKKAPAVPSRPSTPVMGGPRMAALPPAIPAAAAVTAASTPRAPALAGAR
ncbi:unnamed protein product [Prunus brigantina]